MGSYKVLYDYPNYASLPAVGDVSRLYITNDTNTLYRWVDGAYHFFTTTSVPWGNIDGVLTNQTDLMAVLNGKQPLITAETSAQYYRGDKTFQTLNTTVVPEGTNLYWTDARFNTGFSGKSTTNLTEGSNLYYTDVRFDSRLATKSTSNLTEGSNLYWTNARFDTRLGLKTTSDLSEGSNLYYTDARFDTRFGTKTTDNLTEGSTKLYYSSSRFNADFNNKNTDNLPEGSTNLFWTPSRSRNALTLLTVGTSGLATYNSTTGQLNIPQYQDLLVNPLVGAGAQYYVPRYSGTTSLTPGLIYDNGVYVGINRTNPFYTLDVNGTLNVEGVSIYRNLAGTGDRLVYVSSNGTLTPAIIGSGLSIVSGTLSATGTASGSIGGSGTIGYIPKFSGTAAITNSNIQDSGTTISLGSETRITSGSLAIGAASLTGRALAINKTITGATTSVGMVIEGVVQSDATSAYYYQTFAQVQNTVFTLSHCYHYIARGNFSGSATVTNQYAFFAEQFLTSATNNYGFYGAIPSGSNRWNIYMAGTADNYLAGSLGVGTTSLTGYVLNIAKNITGGTTAYGIRSQGTVQSDVTTLVSNYGSLMNTAAASFTLTDFVHHRSMQGTIGSGSAVTNQYGYFADSSMTGATNNYGFYGNIASGTNRWNIYMNGTANNYMAGDTSIGTTSLGTATKFTLGGSETASSTIARGQLINTTLVASANSDVLTALDINPTYTNGSFLAVVNFGLRIVNGNVLIGSNTGIGGDNTKGFTFISSDATMAVKGTSSAGFSGMNMYDDTNSLTGSIQIGNSTSSFSNNLFFGARKSTGKLIFVRGTSATQSGTLFSTGNWLLQDGGTQTDAGFRLDVTGTSRFSTTMLINGSSANASALLQVDSTTQGVLFPRMTTTQKNAISSPATGLVVFDTTLGKLCVFSTTWQTITSV